MYLYSCHLHTVYCCSLHGSADFRITLNIPLSYHALWSVARALSPFPSKAKVSKPWTEAECIECNESWETSKSINCLFIGVYFILCDCYCDVIYDVHPKENSGNK